jgi:hypothetical protein
LSADVNFQVLNFILRNAKMRWIMTGLFTFFMTIGGAMTVYITTAQDDRGATATAPTPKPAVVDKFDIGTAQDDRRQPTIATSPAAASGDGFETTSPAYQDSIRVQGRAIDFYREQPAMVVAGKTAEIASQTRTILARYKATTDAGEKSKLAGELKTAVDAEFVFRQEAREKEIVALEERVKKIRDLQARRLAEKDRIVQARVDLLLREADGLGWGDNSGLGELEVELPMTREYQLLLPGVSGTAPGIIPFPPETGINPIVPATAPDSSSSAEFPSVPDLAPAAGAGTPR